MKYFSTLAAAVAATTGLVSLATPASAQTQFIVTPDGFENTDASGISQGRPFNSAGDRFQQIYSSDFFDGPTLITEVRFRAANPANSFRPDAITASDSVITFSTSQSAANAGGIAGAYDTNLGLDATVVRTGSLTLDRGGSNTSGPQPFDPGFVLDTPFLFNPALGNLLLDIFIPDAATVSASSGFGAVEDLDLVTDQPDIDGVASKTGEFGANSSGLVTQFTGTTVAVPEPTMVAAGLLGGGLLLLRRRRD